MEKRKLEEIVAEAAVSACREKRKQPVLKEYDPDLISDAERLLDALGKIHVSKRPLVVAIMTAYINGIEAGQGLNETAYIQNIRIAEYR